MNVFFMSLTSYHNNIFLANAIISSPFNNDEIYKYIGRVFHEMINDRIVSKPNDKLICVVVDQTKFIPHIVVIERKERSTIKNTDIKLLIEEIVKHPLLTEKIPLYGVLHDTTQPILRCDVPSDQAQIGESDEETYKNIYETFGDVSVHFVLTIR